jgi:phosphohistidine phosphatase
MKHLFLLRHAKSSWDDPSLADFERPLAPRGVRAAERLARYIQEAALSFDLVLCSDAERARETWERIAGAMDSSVPTIYEDALYMAGAPALMARLRELDPTVNTALLVGHNPDLETLARRLCGRGEDAALARLAAKYPTGGLAEIALDCADWPSLKDGCGILERFTVPRELP